MPDKRGSDDIEGADRISGAERGEAGGLASAAERATEDDPDGLDGRAQNAVGGIRETGREAKHGQQRGRLT